MADDVDYRFHAQRLLENPAWVRAIEQLRSQLASERDQLKVNDVEGRWAVTVAESMVTRIERKVVDLARTGKIEAYHARMAEKVA